MNLPSGTLNTPEKIINDNTMFPYYRRFLSFRRAFSIVGMMCGNDGNRIHTSIGVTASAVPQIRWLRFCKECIAEDEELYGESYWHRSHQLFGMIRCHRHKSWLTESQLPTTSSGSRRCFSALDEISSQGGHSLESNIESRSWEDLAGSSYWLLNTHTEHVHEANTLRKRYLWWLWKNQLVPNPFTLNFRKVSEQLLAYYGENFLHQLHCDFSPCDDSNWVIRLLRKQRKMIHPLHHILFMNFLGITPEKFFQYSEQPYQPFGRGPWPCLNPVAPHYRERVITKCECNHLNERGGPVGIFTCSCGYSYGRIKHDESSNDDCFLREWVIKFGPIWEAELLRLLQQEGLSLRETAKQLDVDVNTVRLQLSRLDEGKAWLPEQINEVSSEADECTLRRGNWLKLLNQFPGKGRKYIRMQAKADYAWLYRHDREWFFNHQPGPISRTVAKERIDWLKRDSELATRISSATEAIKNLPGLPQRISIAAIGNYLDMRALLEKKLQKLPQTAKVLDALVDSDDSFITRRLSYVIKAMQAENIPLAPWRIVREASIRDSPEVQMALTRLLMN